MLQLPVTLKGRAGVMGRWPLLIPVSHTHGNVGAWTWTKRVGHFRRSEDAMNSFYEFREKFFL